MSWVKLDDLLTFDEKIVRAGNEAVGAWVRMLVWAAAHSSDGQVPAAVAALIVGEPSVEANEANAVLLRLLAVCLLHQQGHECGKCDRKLPAGTFYLHDFLDYNYCSDGTPPRLAVELRDKRVSAGRKGGIASGAARRNQAREQGVEANEANASKQTRSKRQANEATRTRPGKEQEIPAVSLADGVVRQLPAPREPDVVWDALMSACHVDTTTITTSARGAYNRAVAGLKHAGADPAEISRRAGVFTRRWPTASLTPTALERRWAECDQTPASGNGNGRAGEFTALAERLRERS